MKTSCLDSGSERSSRICVVFDEDTSDCNAEVVIEHVAPDPQSDSVSLDELDPLGTAEASSMRPAASLTTEMASKRTGIDQRLS